MPRDWKERVSDRHEGSGTRELGSHCTWGSVSQDRETLSCFPEASDWPFPHLSGILSGYRGASQTQASYKRAS